MEFLRIGDKLVSRDRILRMVDRILERRVAGASQQEVANDLGVDRSFVSRLESLGEVRKGGKIALVGFPVANKKEILEVAEEFGVDYLLLMNDEERWHWVHENTSAGLINEIMGMMAEIRAHDTVIYIGSDMRIKMTEALTDKQIIPINIGESPIKGDREVDIVKLRQILSEIRGR